MAKTWFRGVLFALLALIPAGFAWAAGPATPPATPDPAIRGLYGDWALRCETTGSSISEQCVLVQNVYAEGKPEIQLVVVVLRAPDGGYLLRVVVPLGIILPAGLGLKIDGTDIGKTGFMRCLANGCMAEVSMDDGLVGRFSTGSTALFIIFPTPGEGTGIPIPLAGFTNGLARLP